MRLRTVSWRRRVPRATRRFVTCIWSTDSGERSWQRNSLTGWSGAGAIIQPWPSATWTLRRAAEPSSAMFRRGPSRGAPKPKTPSLLMRWPKTATAPRSDRGAAFGEFGDVWWSERIGETLSPCSPAPAAARGPEGARAAEHLRSVAKSGVACMGALLVLVFHSAIKMRWNTGRSRKRLFSGEPRCAISFERLESSSRRAVNDQSGRWSAVHSLRENCITTFFASSLCPGSQFVWVAHPSPLPPGQIRTQFLLLRALPEFSK